MRMFPQSIMVTLKTYGKYKTQDFYNITPHDFSGTRVITGTISIE